MDWLQRRELSACGQYPARSVVAKKASCRIEEDGGRGGRPGADSVSRKHCTLRSALFGNKPKGSHARANLSGLAWHHS